MPTIEPLRGLRYDPASVGSLSDVVAPPYDVIDARLQDELYRRHPANVIRLELNRDEPGDDPDARYARAAILFQQWRDDGVLRQEDVPALYVYHQTFEHDGHEVTRRGFMCRTRLERFGEGRVYPHEQTHASAKADRLKLTRACRANLSQVFGLYPDAENEAQTRVERAVEGRPPLEAIDHLGVRHRMWVVTEPDVIEAVQRRLEPLPMFIADGHHRYETACNYRDELMAQGPLDPYHPANYVLTMCVSMNDPGLVVLPTHRLFRGLQPLTSSELSTKLGACFSCQRPAGKSGQQATTATTSAQRPELAYELWATLQAERDQGTLAFWTEADRQWTLARLTDAGRAQMAQVANQHSSDWQRLGVAILHRLVIQHCLGYETTAQPTYVHQVEEVVAGLKENEKASAGADRGGGGDGPSYPLAALVMPATVEDIRAISEHGERMPAKSTYFYPKLLSGLVIYPLQ